MKQQDIIKVVEDKFRTLNKLANKILVSYHNDVIHEFRHEVKKLRSFLRLVSYNQPLPLSLSLPKKLKKFYGYVGIIRNLQLQQETISEYCERTRAMLPQNYLTIIAAEEAFWRTEAKVFIEDANNFYDDEQKIVEMVPAALKAIHMNSFVDDKVNNINNLFNRLHDDETLHKVRKLLKDILFNLPFLSGHIDDLPAGIRNKAEFEALTNTLGSFRDICIAINHLQAAYIDRIRNPQEKDVLQSIELAWLQEKEKIKEEVRSMLQRLDFSKQQSAPSSEHV
jgi:CHAD domain-containing protein